MIVGAFAVVLVIAGKGDGGRRSPTTQVSDTPSLGWAFSLSSSSRWRVAANGGFVGKFYILRASVERATWDCHHSGGDDSGVLLLLPACHRHDVHAAGWKTGRLVGRPPASGSRRLRTVTLLLGLLPSWPLVKARQSVQGLARGRALSPGQRP